VATTIEDLRQRLQLERQLIARLKTANIRFTHARPTAWIILLLVLMGPLIPIVAHLSRFLPKLGV
jgi:hypothetical protein